MVSCRISSVNIYVKRGVIPDLNYGKGTDYVNKENSNRNKSVFYVMKN